MIASILCASFISSFPSSSDCQKLLFSVVEQAEICERLAKEIMAHGRLLVILQGFAKYRHRFAIPLHHHIYNPSIYEGRK